VSAGYADGPLTIALAGQPNVGKSTIFNALTGMRQHVGNWPGKTVERKQGVFPYEGREIRIVDLPGAYGLTASSEEERIARDFVIKERPDVVIMVANAAALERNLYLLAELLALQTPVVLGLNMIDVAQAEGVEIAPAVLEATLGLPVTAVKAVRNEGVAELVTAAVKEAEASHRSQRKRPEVDAAHRRTLARLTQLVAKSVPQPYQPDWIALKLLEGDGEISALARGWMSELEWRPVANLLAQNDEAVLDIVGARYAWVDRMVKAAVRRGPHASANLTERIDRLLLHPIGGMAALLCALGLTFGVTFAIAWPIQRALETGVIAPMRQWSAQLLSGAPAWLSHFVSDGLIGGVGLVVTFVPLLLVFYAVFGLLEDTGYLARVAYLTDRFMHRIGLHGKSFLPFCLGFGCNVPAIMGARVIESPSGRLLTILLAPLVPCSARFAVLAFLTPAFFGAHALWASCGLVLLNLAVLVLVGALLNHTLFRGERVAFVMELPLYHAPNPRSIGLFVWSHTWSFLRRASTTILAVATAVWTLGYFPDGEIQHSYLAQMGGWLEPLGALLGFDWRLTVALLTSFVAKENAIATLGVLYGGAEGDSLAQALSSSVSIAAGLSFLVTTMLFIPCAATVAAMRQETRSWKWTLFSVALLLAIAILGGAVSFHVAGWFFGRAP
jgi:ferrous iron transport protein B